jgi:ABC-type antimicrobial peptide transport system permease subunit
MSHDMGNFANMRGSIMGRGGKDLDIEIVGLVQNVKYSEVKAKIPPVFYTPYRQDESLGFLTFYAKTSLDPDSVLGAVPRIVKNVDPNLPVEDLRTLPEQIRQNVFLDRFITTLSTAFAVIATLLAAIGLYGVLAYTVAQRTREIGLRIALGATPVGVRHLILKQVGWMTLVGGIIGLAGAAAAGRGAASQDLLFELKAYDPAVFASAVVALAVVAFGAGFLPALRASRVSPMVALHDE